MFRRVNNFFLSLCSRCRCACSAVVMMVLFQPQGSIAQQEMRLIIIAVLLMLIVVLPVIVMTVVISWRYRASNTKATYAPNWDHSTKFEIIGGVCLVLLLPFCLLIIWVTSHTLILIDP